MAMTAELQRAKPRTRRLAVPSLCLLLAGSALLATACGSTPAPTSAGRSVKPASAAGSASPARSASTTSAAKVSLEIAFTGQQVTPGQSWTLRCDPAGGTYPKAARACAELAKLRDIFWPPLGHVMCPMIMTTAARITVKGTYYGRKVDETIIDGGCDITRWAKLRQIFN
jgi:Subtilisin inhibitor-like